MRISDWSSDVCSSDLGDADCDRAARSVRPLQRSNFVDSTSEEVVRSTPSTAPIRSVSASMSPIVGTTPVAAKSQMPLTDCRLRTSGICRSRSEEHTSELQSLMRISYAVFCLKTKKRYNSTIHKNSTNQ